MHLNCTKLNDLMIELIKIGVWIAYYLFLTLLHLKSKKIGYDEKLNTSEKLPNK